MQKMLFGAYFYYFYDLFVCLRTRKIMDVEWLYCRTEITSGNEEKRCHR